MSVNDKCIIPTHTHTIKPSGLQLGELRQGFLLFLSLSCSFLLCFHCPRLSTAPLGPGRQSKALMRQCQLFVWPCSNGSLNRKNAWKREKKKERKKSWRKRENGHLGMWWYWEIICHLPPPLLVSVVSHRSLTLSLSFSPFLTLSLSLYLLSTACASVGLQLITGVITHILDDLIGEKAYKSS